jgi:hypothetical protein
MRRCASDKRCWQQNVHRHRAAPSDGDAPGRSAVYANVGQASGRGYPAVMAVTSVPVGDLRPGSDGQERFWPPHIRYSACMRGRDRWRRLTSLAVPALPAAFVGRLVALPASLYVSAALPASPLFSGHPLFSRRPRERYSERERWRGTAFQITLKASSLSYNDQKRRPATPSLTMTQRWLLDMFSRRGARREYTRRLAPSLLGLTTWSTRSPRIVPLLEHRVPGSPAG